MNKLNNFSLKKTFGATGTNAFLSNVSEYIGEHNRIKFCLKCNGNLTLKIYKSNTPYYTFGNNTSNNFSDFELERSISYLSNTNYVKTIPIDGKYIMIGIDNPNSNSTEFSLTTHIGTQNFAPLTKRDENITTNDFIGLTRPTTNWDIDVKDDNLEGFESIEITARGGLSTTEALLRNSGLNDDGYFDPTNSALDTMVNSNVATDSAGNIGALKILIKGTGAFGEERSEEATLQGTTGILTNTDWRAVNSMEVSDLGLNAGVGLQHNVGDIIIRQFYPQLSGGVGQDAMCVIEAGNGISFNPIFDVPYNKILYITKLSINSFCEDEGEIYINKHIYNNNKWIRKRLKTIHLHSQQHLEIKTLFRINGNTASDSNNGAERLTITRKSINPLVGTNNITVSLYGFMKVINL